MSQKADALKAIIRKEYNLESGQIRINCALSGHYMMRFYEADSRNGTICWVDKDAPGKYYLLPHNHYVYPDDCSEYIELLTIAADIMRRLENGELG